MNPDDDGFRYQVQNLRNKLKTSDIRIVIHKENYTEPENVKNKLCTITEGSKLFLSVANLNVNSKKYFYSKLRKIR